MVYQGKSERINYIIAIIAVIGLILTIELTQVIGMNNAYQQMHLQSNQQLSNLVGYIDNILGRFDRIPKVLSKHPVLSQALISPNEESKIIKLNQLLKQLVTKIFF